MWSLGVPLDPEYNQARISFSSVGHFVVLLFPLFSKRPAINTRTFIRTHPDTSCASVFRPFMTAQSAYL